MKGGVEVGLGEGEKLGHALRIVSMKCYINKNNSK